MAKLAVSQKDLSQNIPQLPPRLKESDKLTMVREWIDSMPLIIDESGSSVSVLTESGDATASSSNLDFNQSNNNHSGTFQLLPPTPTPTPTATITGNAQLQPPPPYSNHHHSQQHQQALGLPPISHQQGRNSQPLGAAPGPYSSAQNSQPHLDFQHTHQQQQQPLQSHYQCSTSQIFHFSTVIADGGERGRALPATAAQLGHAGGGGGGAGGVDDNARLLVVKHANNNAVDDDEAEDDEDVDDDEFENVSRIRQHQHAQPHTQLHTHNSNNNPHPHQHHQQHQQQTATGKSAPRNFTDKETRWLVAVFREQLELRQCPSIVLVRAALSFPQNAAANPCAWRREPSSVRRKLKRLCVQEEWRKFAAS